MMDNDIIKALEWHLNRETHCNKCPYKEFKNRNDENCVGRMLKDALDLIDRKDAEIERLQKENKITREYLHNNGLEWDLLSYSKRKEHN